MKPLKAILYLLVIYGLVSVGIVSFRNMTGDPCPSLLFIPVCYIVTIAYGLILYSIVTHKEKLKSHLFCAGWGLAFSIALFASLAEFFGSGGVCPVSGGGSSLRGAESTGGIPLCYLSLLLLAIIGVLFNLTNREPNLTD